MLIEARLTWEGDLLGVAHVPARGCVRASDFGLPIPGDPREIVAEGGCLTRNEIHVDGVTARFSLTSSERVPRFALGEFRTTKGVALATVLHVTVLAMAFIGRAAPHEEDAGRFETLKSLSAAIDAREPGAEENTLLPIPKDETKDPKKSEPGMAGSPMATKLDGLAMRSKGAENPEVTRQKELREAREFGMIGLLTPPGAAHSGSSPFSSFEGPSAVGSLFGSQIDDSFGFGGAGLSGTGSGGGGRGEGITLAGPGIGQGYGCGCGGHGILGGGHSTRVPTLRCGGEYDEKTKTFGECPGAQVNGRLPPEIVQRIVRQNFGRMRLCYEAGLKRDPSLEGRIAVKFVIDRSGAVSMVSTAERSFSDRDVAACVERSFMSMSFPEPEGGIVTVVYPLVLST